MTLWYSSRKPDVFDLPAIAALKWSHSVMQEPDFCCEFGAREAAHRLAFEIELEGDHLISPSHSSPSNPRTSRRPGLHVGFADTTELRLSFEDDWKFHAFSLPSHYFASGITPWSGCQKIAEMKQSRFHFCPWHDGGLVRSCEPTHAQEHHRIASTPADSSRVKNFENEQFIPSFNFDKTPSDSSNLTGRLSGMRQHFADNAVVDPNEVTGDTSSHPGIIEQFKITDNYYDNPARRIQQEPEEPDPDVIPDIHEAPQFAQDLHAIAGRFAIYDDPDGDGILRLRTWYLHHQHMIVNFHSRTVELDEDWRRWSDDIIGSWRTHLHAGASIFFHLVHPDPYRGYLRQEVHCDVIITQGNELPRRAGLLTVHYQGEQTDPHTYAVASSLEMIVSGRRLVEAADADQWCLNSFHRCSVAFGWQHIPFDTQPIHQVQNGHAFIIMVTKARQEHDLSLSGQAESHGQNTQEHDYEEAPHFGEFAQTPQSVRSASSLSSRPDLEVGVHVFRLGMPDDHCYVGWQDYRQILYDITRRVHAQRNEIVALHYLQAHPIGIHSENEKAVILQSIHDIPAASMEQLILLDLEIHYHALPSGLLVPPTVSRRVMRIHPPLHRSQMLLLTGLNDYCELHGDKCIIFENNLIWSSNDRTVHALTHGAYIRIQVPPPDDPLLDTESAIAISREFALESDRGHFATFCPGNHQPPPDFPPPEDDGSAFLQHSIRSFVASCSAWQVQWQPMQLKVSPAHVVQPAILSASHDQQQGPAPQRPFSGFHGRDFDTLSNLFASHSMIECEEEGPIAYVDTWYIHHERQQQCRAPRAVRLLQDPAEWLEDLLAPWRDIIDPTIAITIFLVRPSPPCTQMECLLAHFIIEQAPRPEWVVGLISIQEVNPQGISIDHRAFSLPSLMWAQAVIRVAGIQERCRFRSCTVQRGAIPFGVFDMDHVDPGMSLVIHVRDRMPFVASSSIEGDISGLMQRPPDPHAAARPPAGPAAAAPFVFNPNAAAFCPGQAPLNVHSA